MEKQTQTEPSGGVCLAVLNSRGASARIEKKTTEGEGASFLSRDQNLDVEKQVGGVVMIETNGTATSAYPAIDATPKACTALMLPFSPCFSLRRTPQQPPSQCEQRTHRATHERFCFLAGRLTRP